MKLNKANRVEILAGLAAGIALAVLIAAPTAMAERLTDEGQRVTLPENYPTIFSARGRLQEVDARAGELVMEAVRYRLPAGVAIMSADGAFPLNRLRAGMAVGLITEPGEGRYAGRVREIWLLPTELAPPH